MSVIGPIAPTTKTPSTQLIMSDMVLRPSHSCNGPAIPPTGIQACVCRLGLADLLHARLLRCQLDVPSGSDILIPTADHCSSHLAIYTARSNPSRKPPIIFVELAFPDG